MAHDYPSTRRDFDTMFATEEACMAFLGKLRWARGFVCMKCGGTAAWALARCVWECARCGAQRSPTEGTLLHRTRFPLKTWFDAAWHVCEQKNGMSALGLQRAMGFGSYHTAWEWLHRMRQAMVLPRRTKLSGEVEVDEAYIGGVKPGKRGRGAAGKALVMVAAEVRGTAIGRIRLHVIPDSAADTLVENVELLIERESDVITDGLAGYNRLTSLGYHHTISRYTPAVGKNLLPKAHRVIALLKRWLLGTHQGAISHQRLQAYLDEFVFRFNRRTSRSRGLLFYRLLQQAVQHEPISKKSIMTEVNVMGFGRLDAAKLRAPAVKATRPEEPRHRAVLAPQIRARIEEIKAEDKLVKEEILAMEEPNAFALNYLRAIKARQQLELLESLGLKADESSPTNRR